MSPIAHERPDDHTYRVTWTETCLMGAYIDAANAEEAIASAKEGIANGEVGGEWLSSEGEDGFEAEHQSDCCDRPPAPMRCTVCGARDDSSPGRKCRAGTAHRGGDGPCEGYYVECNEEPEVLP